MKRKIQIVMIVIFLSILLLPSFIWGILWTVNPELTRTLDFDLGENREKNSLPESFHGNTVGAELEAWYTDRVPFRSILISTSQRLTGTLEGYYQENIQPQLTAWIYGNKSKTTQGQMDLEAMFGTNATEDCQEEAVNTQEENPPLLEETPEMVAHTYEVTEQISPTCLEEGITVYLCTDCQDTYTEVIPALGHTPVAMNTVEATYLNYGYTEYQCSGCNIQYRDDFEGKLIATDYLPPKTVGDGVILGRFNWLFYSGDGSVSYYKGTNLLEDEKLAEYLGLAVRLQELCQEREIQLQFMIMPNREQMYPEYMPSYEVVETEKRVDRLVAYFRENSDINIIYPFEELREAELYWQTYYQYDTHWNCAGAFIGTQALYKALGLPVTSLHDLDVTTKPADIRGLIDMGGLDSDRYPCDEDYVFTYQPQVQVTYTNGDPVHSMIYRAESDSPNQCNFVMLSDSFRAWMIPYLERDFSHIVVAHRDYVESVRDSVKEADILVITAVERYDNRIFKTVKSLISILEEQ